LLNSINGKYFGTEAKLKGINTIFNGFMHLLIQKYGTDRSNSLYNQYGRTSGLLEKGKENNLKAQFIKLFRDNKNIELRDFSRQNLFLRNFTTTDVKNTNMFYITMKTVRKN